MFLNIFLVHTEYRFEYIVYFTVLIIKEFYYDIFIKELFYDIFKIIFSSVK